ncbi:ABC transporter ATP-binding protein [Azoarcus sp. KH32C]|uniref:ABC transporter ATP-binding protein n=1 Tax=Azoarcus sp. KH32C TaxID=748247 RepID=UPI0002386E03|nr:ABC transporter ATP-binding protein [Azoarcus sp. KH32C]BAL26056.1 lipopolysaccharide transport system ATP-binding protein [Azoarcus sp. KH32C]
MSSEIAIAVRDVSKVYHIYERPQDRLKQMLWRGRRKFHDDFWALQGIDFEVEKGETVGIVGRNGSGKSTLLQIICGTLTPTTGTVERKGRISALLELGSGFNPEFSGRENVYLNGSILGLSRAEVDERFDRIAAFADIGQFIDSPVKHYSSGMFARLAFSVAVHVDPEILIVDEILAVGDAAFQRRCMSKFYEIRESGCTILFVSHDQYQVKSVCQRAVYLERGMQKMFGPAGRVIDAYMVDMEAVEAARLPPVTKPVEALVAEPVATGDVPLEEPAVEPALAPPSQILFPYLIESVRMSAADGRDVDEVATGDELILTMRYRAITPTPPDRISFVFNLYRHDGFYVCGTTTLMDGMAPHPGTRNGEVSVRFPSFPLLSGRYKWRVAINDHGGFSVLAEAKEVCPFSVVDNFDAVGIVNLAREWQFSIG